MKEMDEQRMMKVSFEGEKRRIALAPNFESLQQKLADLFNLKIGQFAITYQDEEGDLITIGSDKELQEYLNSNKEKVVKFNLHSLEEENSQNRKRKFFQSEDKREHTPSFGKFIPLLTNYVTPLLQENMGFLNQILNVSNYVCDKCDSKINGTRFHCSTCKDFDYCADCFAIEKEHSQQHIFEEIKPETALQEALSKVKNVAIDVFYSPSDETENNMQTNNNLLAQTNFQFPINSNNNSNRIEETDDEEDLSVLEQKKKAIEQTIAFELEKKSKVEDKIEKEKVGILLQNFSIGGEENTNIDDNSKGKEELIDDSANPNNNNEFPFRQQLETLESMGFLDRKLNILLLNKFNGNLESVLRELTKTF